MPRTPVAATDRGAEGQSSHLASRDDQPRSVQTLPTVLATEQHETTRKQIKLRVSPWPGGLALKPPFDRKLARRIVFCRLRILSLKERFSPAQRVEKTITEND
jgi:hypothetical protein